MISLPIATGMNGYIFLGYFADAKEFPDPMLSHVMFESHSIAFDGQFSSYVMEQVLDKTDEVLSANYTYALRGYIYLPQGEHSFHLEQTGISVMKLAGDLLFNVNAAGAYDKIFTAAKAGLYEVEYQFTPDPKENCIDSSFLTSPSLGNIKQYLYQDLTLFSTWLEDYVLGEASYPLEHVKFSMPTENFSQSNAIIALYDRPQSLHKVIDDSPIIIESSDHNAAFSMPDEHSEINFENDFITDVIRTREGKVVPLNNIEENSVHMSFDNKENYIFDADNLSVFEDIRKNPEDLILDNAHGIKGITTSFNINEAFIFNAKDSSGTRHVEGSDKQTGIVLKGKGWDLTAIDESYEAINGGKIYYSHASGTGMIKNTLTGGAISFDKVDKIILLD